LPVALLRARAAVGCRICIINEDLDERVEAVLGIDAVAVAVRPPVRTTPCTEPTTRSSSASRTSGSPISRRR
jgi:hypothetical protein